MSSSSAGLFGKMGRLTLRWGRFASITENLINYTFNVGVVFCGWRMQCANDWVGVDGVV